MSNTDMIVIAIILHHTSCALAQHCRYGLVIMKIDGEKNAVIFGMVIIKTLCCESTLYAVPVFDVAIVSPTVTRYLPQNS